MLPTDTATSPDGKVWTHTPEPVWRHNPRPGTDDLGPVGDAQAMMVDKAGSRYIAFLRGSNSSRMLSTSEDFVRWTPPETFLTAQHEDEATYNNTGFDYGCQYLGFLTHFDKAADRQSQSLRLLSSRDASQAWQRPNMQGPPLIAPGGVDSWDRFQIMLTGTAPIRVGDRLYIYYRGTPRRHNKAVKEFNADIDADQDKYPAEGPDMGLYGMAIGLATIRLDGWASVSASYDGGWLTTIPFSAGSSKSLRLNAKCDFGRIVVELLHADSEVTLPGYFFSDCDVVQADGVDLAVRWGERTALPDQVPFRIRFHLSNARLFSYRAVGL